MPKKIKGQSLMNKSRIHVSLIDIYQIFCQRLVRCKYMLNSPVQGDS